MLRNNSGYALVYVLLILFVFSILSISLLLIEANSTKDMVFQREEKQAYNLAWTGASTVGQYLIDNPDSINNLLNKTSDKHYMESGYFYVNVTRDTNYIYVKSNGYAGKSINSVTLTLCEVDTEDFIITEYAIVSPDIKIVSNSKVEGIAAVTEDGRISVSDNATVTDVKHIDKYNIYELPMFPSFSSIPLDPDITSNASITGSYACNKISLKDATLYIEGDADIFLKELKLEEGGKIVVSKSSKVNFYVSEKIDINGSSLNKAKVGSRDNIGHITIYYKGSENVVFSDVDLFSSLYIESNNLNYMYYKMDLTIGNNSKIYGNILCSTPTNIRMENGAFMKGIFWSPNSDTYITGNNTILQGFVIAKDVTIHNRARLVYDDSIFGEDELISNIKEGYTIHRWK
ncbi:hypothetical protein RBH29_15460 [Herbivorax sp. ANBcel31]|uniref:hypothetical protein n=1 Tax=Herbivorax sp. ANBcel31 TaxID=3069754 RepID=UPI0027B32976|nr:hypothetical protein [Herbivorax sp. ANBcel31]MDQ2087828.1 hypothetical protein [Herbivorax sp. ANBcel31]